jgi:hypothetical protein
MLAAHLDRTAHDEATHTAAFAAATAVIDALATRQDKPREPVRGADAEASAGKEKRTV